MTLEQLIAALETMQDRHGPRARVHIGAEHGNMIDTRAVDRVEDRVIGDSVLVLVVQK